MTNFFIKEALEPTNNNGLNSLSVNKLLEDAVDNDHLPVESIVKLNNLITEEELVTNTLDFLQDNVTLFNFIIDDSQSVSKVKDSVIKLQNQIIDNIIGLRERIRDTHLIRTVYFNEGIISDLKPIEQATRLSNSNYSPKYNSVPLYDVISKVLGITAINTNSYYNVGISVNSVTVIITYGEDHYSKLSNLNDVFKIVNHMNNNYHHVEHNIYAYSIGENESLTDIFTQMGIIKKFIITSDENQPDNFKMHNMIFKNGLYITERCINYQEMLYES